MPVSVNRDAFPKSGSYLSFLKMFTSLDPSKRKNVFISPTDAPGEFNYCVFPNAVNVPPENQRYITTAEAVAEIMKDSNGSLFPNPRHS